jgi:RNA polymerase sigma-70 factor (ECF subfamily)
MGGLLRRVCDKLARMSVTRLSLLERIRDPADNVAWGEFFTTYEPLLLSYVRRRSRDRGLGWGEHDIRDVVQEVFIKLFRTMPTFQLDHGKGRFRTWLWRITTNAMIDRVPDRKTYKRRLEAASEDGEMAEPRRPKMVGEGERGLENLAAPQSEPDVAWDEEYRQAILRSVLDELRAEIEPQNPNKWASFEQHGLRGRPAADVAAELGINANLVYQNTARVLRAVSQACQEKYEEGLEDAAA